MMCQHGSALSVSAGLDLQGQPQTDGQCGQMVHINGLRCNPWQ